MSAAKKTMTISVEEFERMKAAANGGGIRGSVKATKKKDANGQWVDDPSKPTKIEVRIGNAYPFKAIGADKWQLLFDNLDEVKAIVAKLEGAKVGETATA